MLFIAIILLNKIFTLLKLYKKNELKKAQHKPWNTENTVWFMVLFPKQFPQHKSYYFWEEFCHFYLEDICGTLFSYLGEELNSSLQKSGIVNRMSILYQVRIFLQIQDIFARIAMQSKADAV